MKTKPTHAQLMNERLQLVKDHCNVLSPEKEDRKEAIANGLLHGSKFGDRSSSLLDLHLGNITHHYSVHSDRLIYDVLTKNISDNWKHVHLLSPKDDAYSIAEAEVVFYKRLMSLPPVQYMQLIMTNMRRLKNKNEGSDLYLIRCKVVECDVNGLPWLVLIETFLLLQFKERKFFPLRQVFLVAEKSDKIIQRFEADNIDPLTDMERKVLMLKYYDCATNDEIKDRLKLGAPTVKTHLNQAMQKMCSHSVQMACMLIKFMRIFE